LPAAFAPAADALSAWESKAFAWFAISECGFLFALLVCDERMVAGHASKKSSWPLQYGQCLWKRRCPAAQVSESNATAHDSEVCAFGARLLFAEFAS